MMEYLCDVKNYVSLDSLNNCLPYEAFWGETPDIPMICFKFWEPVYFRNWTYKSGKVLMHPGRFMAFTWNVGDPMTFKMLQCNANPHKCNMVVHRGVIITRNLEVTGYRSDLGPKSDASLPEVNLESGPSIITAIPGQKGTMDLPDISISEGGGKRHKPSSSPLDGINHAEVDQTATECEEAAEDGQGNVDEFTAMANQVNVNKNGTTDDMA